MSYLEWIEVVESWMDLSVSDEEICKRLYSLGQTPRDAIAAMRDVRELEDEEQFRDRDRPWAEYFSGGLGRTH